MCKFRINSLSFTIFEVDRLFNDIVLCVYSFGKHSNRKYLIQVVEAKGIKFMRYVN
jgi:hypothetical protein